jgi:hypothetical protein
MPFAHRTRIRAYRLSDSGRLSFQATFAALALAAACGAPSTSKSIVGPPEIVYAREQLDDDIALCTKRYGYDPKADSKLGTTGLAPGEREWRECAYQGIEKYLIPRTLSPDVYRRAITEDRKLTEELAQGEITRAQRQARVQQMLDEIDQTEEANQSKVEMDRLEMEMRQDMIRRGLGPLRR